VPRHHQRRTTRAPLPYPLVYWCTRRFLISIAYNVLCCSSVVLYAGMLRTPRPAACHNAAAGELDSTPLLASRRRVRCGPAKPLTRPRPVRRRGAETTQAGYVQTIDALPLPDQRCAEPKARRPAAHTTSRGLCRPDLTARVVSRSDLARHGSSTRRLERRSLPQSLLLLTVEQVEAVSGT